MNTTDEVRLKDGRKVSIRLLAMADKETLIAFYADLSPEVLKWALPPYDKARVEHFFANPEQLIGIVGFAEGKVVGYLHIFRYTSRMSHVGDLIIYLNQNFVNAGLGTAMMKAGLEHAKAHGLRRVQLTVVEGNKNAVHVYEKVGFRIEGERAEAYMGADGRYYTAIDMGKILQ